MIKAYADYRIKMLIGSLHGVEVEELTPHHDEVNGKFQVIEGIYKFYLHMTLKNAPGVGFSVSSIPINLDSLKKKDIDLIVMDTVSRLIKSALENVALNMTEG